ncbi:MAG TPA: OmpA family protein [Vicinamibacteria bacterium]|nr:OmpA family protein [Vicinamibacteria bacterium]
MTRPAVFLAAVLSACTAAEEPAPAAAPSPAGALGGSAAIARGGPAGEDPEPPDAQARAEAVVGADHNQDKTTKLKMTITTIVGRTSELAGFATNLAPREDKIEDQLARLGAKVTEMEVVIQLPGSILFDFDSADIRPDAHRALDDVVRVIKGYPGRPVRIEGHTDSVASDQYNQSLSERRAASVAAWLAKNGAERSRLAAAGHGESKPVATNDTAAGRQLNRRVEVVITRK